MPVGVWLQKQRTVANTGSNYCSALTYSNTPSDKRFRAQITALEQLRNEMQEELLQQSVENSKLQHTNEGLARQLDKSEDKSNTLQANVASLSEDNLKVGCRLRRGFARPHTCRFRLCLT